MSAADVENGTANADTPLMDESEHMEDIESQTIHVPATDVEAGTANADKHSLHGAEQAEDTKPFTEEDLKPTRRCTDPICFIIFLAVIGMMVVLHLRRFAASNPFKILYPLDHAGNSCGVGNMEDFPLVYFPAKTMIHAGPLAQDAYYGDPKNRWSVCTNECPTRLSRVDRPGKCNEPSGAVNTSAENGATCTWYSTTPTSELLGRYCVAGLSSTEFSDKTGVVCTSVLQAISDVHMEAKRTFNDLGNMTHKDLDVLKMRLPQRHQWIVEAIKTSIGHDVVQYQNVIDDFTHQAKNNASLKQVCTDEIAEQRSPLMAFVEDIWNGIAVLVLSAFWCLFLGAIYIAVLAKVVKPVIYGSLFISIVGFSITGHILWTQGIQVSDIGLFDQGTEEKILAVICWICAFILLVVTIFCRRSLELAIGICECTSSFLLKNMGMIALPVLIGVVAIGWIIYWLAALVAILSAANAKPANDLTEEVYRYEIDGFIVGAGLFHLFMGMWIHFFFEGLSIVTASITVTNWYFAPKVKGSKPSTQWACFGCLLEALTYHVGSVAMGSFILPVALVIRFIVNMFLWAMSKAGQKSCLVRTCLGVINCCFNLVTAIIQLMTTNAFIMVGVQSNGFFSSARSAFALMARNPARFLIFKGVMWTVDVACRFVLMGFTIAFGALLLETPLGKDVRSQWPTLIALAIIGYWIAGLYASSYTTSGASLFFNFVIDEEIISNTGRDASLYAPKGLEALLDAKAERHKQEEASEDQQVEDSNAIKADATEAPRETAAEK